MTIANLINRLTSRKQAAQQTVAERYRAFVRRADAELSPAEESDLLEVLDAIGNTPEQFAADVAVWTEFQRRLERVKPADEIERLMADARRREHAAAEEIARLEKTLEERRREWQQATFDANVKAVNDKRIDEIFNLAIANSSVITDVDVAMGISSPTPATPNERPDRDSHP